VVFDRCDAPGGRDNAAAKMILSNAFLGDIFDEGGKGLGTVGGDTFVVELGDYNGGQNDKQVTLALAATNGFRGDADAGADGGPRYDGTDTWDVLDRSLDQGSTLVDAGACAAISRGACVSKSITKDAYVTGGVLVGRGEVERHALGTTTQGPWASIGEAPKPKSGPCGPKDWSPK
jgi:hypothetical protein